MINYNEFTVCVRSLIFNHAKYINDCLHGFMIQEVNFPVVFMLEEDASTDGTQEILRKFVEENFNVDDKSIARVIDFEGATTTFAQHKTNKNFYVAYIQMKYNHYSKHLKRDEYELDWIGNSKYVALCEGDDYWTDPYKLQKQIDFLETHPDFSMCCHGATVLNETERKIDSRCETMTTREYFPDDAFPTWQIPTASIVYRKDVVLKYPIKRYNDFTAGDVVLILRCMHTGRVWGFADHMSVYRMNPGGLTSMKSTQESCLKECKHHEALMANFPKIDTSFCHRFIAMVYYTKFRSKEPLFDKIHDFCKALWHRPSYIARKLLHIKAKERDDLFYKYYHQ